MPALNNQHREKLYCTFCTIEKLDESTTYKYTVDIQAFCQYIRLVFCALLKKLKAKVTQCFGLWPKTQGFFLKKLKVMRPNPKPGGIEF